MAKEADTRKLARIMGERVRMRRKALGLTQEKLSELADLSPTFIAKLESGVKTPSLDTLIALSQALRTTPADLIADTLEQPHRAKANSLCAALDGLSDQDAGFVEQAMLNLIAYLRKR